MVKHLSLCEIWGWEGAFIIMMCTRKAAMEVSDGASHARPVPCFGSNHPSPQSQSTNHPTIPSQPQSTRHPAQRESSIETELNSAKSLLAQSYWDWQIYETIRHLAAENLKSENINLWCYPPIDCLNVSFTSVTWKPSQRRVKSKLN